MKIELGKMDYGQGMMGFLAYSMVGDGSLKFTPEDEGNIGVTTRIDARSKKLLEQLAEVGGVTQTIIMRVCIERGLAELASILVEVKKAKEAAEQQEALQYQEQAEFDADAFNAEIVDTLAVMRKAAEARKAGRK